jgi:hypothetical protein
LILKRRLGSTKTYTKASALVRVRCEVPLCSHAGVLVLPASGRYPPGVRTAEEAGMRSGVMAAGLLGARTRLGRP